MGRDNGTGSVPIILASQVPFWIMIVRIKVGMISVRVLLLMVAMGIIVRMISIHVVCWMVTHWVSLRMVVKRSNIRMIAVHVQSRLKWAETRRYIDEWLLKSLETSRLKQGRLKHHEEDEIDLSDEKWWDLVEQLWYSNTAEGRDFHTEDTTVSEESRNEPFSSKYCAQVVRHFGYG
jgi:hypothetical protein